VRASGSVRANYIGANEALSKKDFRMRIKVSRKESKVTRYWLRLLDTEAVPEPDAERDRLVQESGALMRIFAAILRKSESARFEHSYFGF
jgi:four helix bundle protein